jgi:hypothetical protein
MSSHASREHLRAALPAPQEKPDGSRLNAPLDTILPVSWVGFANEIPALQVRPVLRRIPAEILA